MHGTAIDGQRGTLRWTISFLTRVRGARLRVRATGLPANDPADAQPRLRPAAGAR
jgi:hypothetical protein